MAQSQVWNTYNLWVRDHVDLNVLGFIVPVPWLQSLDGLMPALSVPIILLFWKRQAARGSEPELLTKMGIGCLIFGAAVLLLVLGSHPPGSTARAPLAIPIAFHVGSTIRLDLFCSGGEYFGVDPCAPNPRAEPCVESSRCR